MMYRAYTPPRKAHSDSCARGVRRSRSLREVVRLESWHSTLIDMQDLASKWLPENRGKWSCPGRADGTSLQPKALAAGQEGFLRGYGYARGTSGSSPWNARPGLAGQ